MVVAQRARDAHMAERLVAGQRDGAVLIAGAGHVRTDQGVPRALAVLAPDAGVASVAFLEVADGWTAPADYAARFGAARLPFDYVWFTARADNADHCARLRERARGTKDVGGARTGPPPPPPPPAPRPSRAASPPPP